MYAHASYFIIVPILFRALIRWTAPPGHSILALVERGLAQWPIAALDERRYPTHSRQVAVQGTT